MSTKHIEKIIGENIRELRISNGIKQADMKTVSARAMSSLENGDGFSVQTMLKALMELNAMDLLGDIVVEKVHSPMDLLQSGGKPRQRVRRGDKKEDQTW